MSNVMSASDLEALTGFKRYSAQFSWFSEQYGIQVARRANGSPVMTWSSLEALQARKYGMGATSPQPVEICYD